MPTMRNFIWCGTSEKPGSAVPLDRAAPVGASDWRSAYRSVISFPSSDLGFFDASGDQLAREFDLHNRFIRRWAGEK